jgi:hypothetical protein
MTDDELDIVLSREERIAASCGFTESVMTALNSEASTPPPIAFPWKWALPGFAAAVVLIAAICVMVLR